MTVENRRFVQLTDFVAVQYTCRACGTRVAVPRAKWNVIPDKCPRCGSNPRSGKAWLPGVNTRIEKLVDELLARLDSLTTEAAEREFDIAFEIATNEE